MGSDGVSGFLSRGLSTGGGGGLEVLANCAVVWLCGCFGCSTSAFSATQIPVNMFLLPRFPRRHLSYNKFLCSSNSAK